MPEEAGRLAEISERLDATARKLRESDIDGEEATRLAGECAELASQAVAELDRLARGTADDAAPGQEELL
jgi:hypothetical protein